MQRIHLFNFSDRLWIRCEAGKTISVDELTELNDERAEIGKLEGKIELTEWRFESAYQRAHSNLGVSPRSRGENETWLHLDGTPGCVPASEPMGCRAWAPTVS